MGNATSYKNNEENAVAAKFNLNEEVVVIVSSGVGGGTLGNELAQKGINVVILEAGKGYEISDFENDEWPMFNKTSWLDKRTTSGTWRLAKDFPNLLDLPRLPWPN